MMSHDRSPEPRSTGELPVIVACIIFLLHLMPGGLLAGLVLWTLASFPIGVLIGHCILSEEAKPHVQ
ncbi:MAG TPA: hypothetical protein VGC82_13295 [Rhodopila sp.]